MLGFLRMSAFSLGFGKNWNLDKISWESLIEKEEIKNEFEDKEERTSESSASFWKQLVHRHRRWETQLSHGYGLRLVSPTSRNSEV